ADPGLMALLKIPDAAQIEASKVWRPRTARERLLVGGQPAFTMDSIDALIDRMPQKNALVLNETTVLMFVYVFGGAMDVGPGAYRARPRARVRR
ncbi:hypothetical protein, partial [Nocardia cyriacigeorgica]|uniref:hypothetical protein n=1 Tax=Nocardia cyriacigeorgica TaxID=135487 RepID=UPI002458951D